MYGEPSGRVDFGSQSRNPQPCFAVRTADVAPIIFIESAHELIFKFEGEKEEGWDELQPVPLVLSQPFQFFDVHPWGKWVGVEEGYVHVNSLIC